MRPLTGASGGGSGVSENNSVSIIEEEDDDQIISLGTEEVRIGGNDDDSSSIDSVNSVMNATLRTPLFGEGQACRFFVFIGTRRRNSSSLGFIGSANTTLLECRMNATHLFSCCDGVLDVVYHPCLSRSSRAPAFQEAVLLLRRSWDAFFDASSSITPFNDSDNCSIESTLPTAFRMQFCAGEGANVVRAALEGYRYAQRIFVVAIAPSCLIRPEACFLVRHYRAENDCISCMHERGGSYPETAVIERSNTSRGYIDNQESSSTFQDFLALEALCFHLRERLLASGALPEDFELQVQQLRDRCLDSKEILGSILTQHRGLHSERMVNREHEILKKKRRELITAFMAEYQQAYILDSGDNLPEIALDEYSRDRCERILTSINILRDTLMIPTSIVLANVADYAGFLPVSVGMPLCQALNTLQRWGVYVIARNPDGDRNLLRQISLRLAALEYITYLYEVGAFGGLIYSGYQPPPFVMVGMGGYLIITGSQLITTAIVRLYSPLRGRIDSSLTEVETQDIVTDRATNTAARSVGLIRRVFRGVVQASTGFSALIVAASAMYPLMAPVFSPVADFNSMNGTGFGANDTEHAAMTAEGISERNIAGMVLVGLTGLISATAVVGNVLQVRRMVRRLRSSEPYNPNNPNFIEAESSDFRPSRYGRHRHSSEEEELVDKFIEERGED